MRSKLWINDRFTKPACHVDRTENSYVTDAIFRMYHFCDSNLQPSIIAFCYYYYCAEEYCVISPCWKKNDVAKMRQAGTAPATGTTIYCLTSLWCNVIYKLLVLCRYYQQFLLLRGKWMSAVSLIVTPLVRIWFGHNKCRRSDEKDPCADSVTGWIPQITGLVE